MARRSLAVLLLVVTAAGCSAVSGLSRIGFGASGGDASGGGTSADGGGGAGGGIGGSVGQCTTAADCSPRDCIDVSCRQHQCVIAPSEAGTACATGVCDGHGSCVGCVNASDCPAPPECKVAVCASRACSVKNADDGTHCGTDSSIGVLCFGGACFGCGKDGDCSGGQVCSSHTCRDGCNDGMADFDETDADCGGPDCQPCGIGKHCGEDADCSSNHCIAGNCK